MLRRVLLQAVPLSCIALCLSSDGAGDQLPTVISHHDEQHLSARGCVMLLVDFDAQFTYEDVNQPVLAGKFQSVRGQALEFDSDASVNWLRLRLRNAAQRPVQRMLEINEPLIESAKAYVRRRGAGAHVEESFSVEQLVWRAGRRPVFPLRLAADEEILVHLRIAPGPAERATLALRTPQAFRAFLSAEQLLLGGFYGGMLLLALFHLGLFLPTGERSYLYCALYLVAFSFSYFVWDGLALEYLWPGRGAWNTVSLTLVDALAAMASIQFTRCYLGTSQQAPQLDRFLLLLIAIAFLVFPMSHPWTRDVAVEMAAVLAVVGPLALLAAAVICLRRGYRPARYLLLAQGVHLVSVPLETALTYVPRLPPTLLDAAEYAVYGGTCLMAVLFSLGLADRYKQQVRKREQAEAENRALKVFSYKDGLTGIWNRRRLDEHLEQEWKRASREGQPLSVIMADVDYFKRYNDNYGHQAGDECLRRVAATLDSTATRPADLVARYGGEEFAILLPDIELHGARQLGEEIRRAVAAMKLPHERSDAAEYVTISVGVASCLPDLNQPPQTLVEAADRALYEAKEGGRNRVVALLLSDIEPAPDLETEHAIPPFELNTAITAPAEWTPGRDPVAR